MMSYLRLRKLPLKEPQRAKPQRPMGIIASGAHINGRTNVPQTTATRTMNAGKTIHHGHGLSSRMAGTVAQGAGDGNG